MSYAIVIVDLPVDKVDKPFTYQVPDELQPEVEIGTEVKVPFRNRKITGYVIEVKAEIVEQNFKIKEISEISCEYRLFDEQLLKLAQWMAKYYNSFLITALKAIIPGGKRKVKTKRVIKLAQTESETESVLKQMSGRAYKQKEVLRYLLDSDKQLSSTELAREVETSNSTIRALLDKDLVVAEDEIIRRRPKQEVIDRTEKFKPTPEQKSAINLINQLREEEKHAVCLLKGITGSGKTEVYLQTIAATIDKGAQAIVLVPEISLTPQTVERFRNRFGDQIAILHSKLSSGERFDEWRRIKAGEAKIAVGARSAVFAPFTNLKLIIIDEEHEQTYKQEDNPKYHARKVAIKRMEDNDGVVVLGSATPDLSSYYHALEGNYKLLELPERINGAQLPKVDLVDMRKELKSGNKTMFSYKLQDKMIDCLENDEQIIIFLNRRGFATFVQCRECGHVLECENCDVSLTYHSNPARLQCHYCNYKLDVPNTCPECASRYIKYFGVGTQKVERALKELYPEAVVKRVDRDTMGKKGAYQKLFNKFKAGKIDILVGTQILAKGHDFANVNLVGVISADVSLNLPDFRAGENTFQLLTQVAGRTGRGLLRGQVIIQSYTPEHYSVKLAKEHDYDAFYEAEIKSRQEMFYPPFSSLTRLLISDKREKDVIKAANYLGDAIREVLLEKGDTSVMVLGPAKAPLERIKGKYRWQIILKGESIASLRTVSKQAVSDWWDNTSTTVKVSVDIDPVRML